MAKKQPGTTKQAGKQTGKLGGQTFAFAGKFGYSKEFLETLRKQAEAEGATVIADPEKAAPDYLVAGAGVGGNPPAVIAKVQKKHPQVSVIDQAAFYQLINPTAEEFEQLMLAGNNEHEFWYELQTRMQHAGNVLDLSGKDFRKREIVGTLYKVCLDDCDFRGATISASFDKVKNAKFDGCTMSEGSFTSAEDCSLKKVTMDSVHWNPAEFKRCDFSGAKLYIGSGQYTKAEHCNFHNADLSESQLERSKFVSADFSGANLSSVDLQKSDLSRADLSGANLTGADLRNVNLTDANLTKAKLHNARLGGATLTGATIDGADFTGANVAGVDLTGLDVTKAKNLQAKTARTAGPNLIKLAQAAQGSKKFMTSIELELNQNEYVVLQPELTTHGTSPFINARYIQYSGQHSINRGIHATSYEQGILDLVQEWAHGKPKLTTIKVEASKCPIKGKELQDLAIKSWYEAFGIDISSAEDMAQATEQVAASQSSLREAMLAELHGGAAGVEKWNARSQPERGNLGKLRKEDFSAADLSGAILAHQDLEGCVFAGAKLVSASLDYAQLKGANFAKANLTEANLAGVKSSEASFENAKLKGCNLRMANFRRCNFQGADLTKAAFEYSDLLGADFSTATLKSVTFRKTNFDENTVFPPDFVPPDGLQWKGVGPRPGTAPPPPPPKSGTLDFEAFVTQLNNKVELARMQKAASMLKKESFQLFAEVKDDSLGGIVKSQTDKDLVYSCRLASDGTFGCCTQNLRPCGGLRGALCKHLLVLIIGLAKAGQLDSATVDHWIDLSRSQKPAIAEEEMSATFLKYKGAEAGEIDWRPTETIPEDFYTM